MIYWAIMLFGLGMLALADYSVTGGEVFGPINSIMFLVMSFAVLIRIRNKRREAQWEKLQQENDELKRQLAGQGSPTKPQTHLQEALV